MSELVIPDIKTIAMVVFMAGTASWAVTEVLKKALAGLLKSKKLEKEPWWHNAALRLSSVVLGGICGLVFQDPMSVVLGVGAGGMNTFLVATVKKFIKRKSS